MRFNEISGRGAAAALGGALLFASTALTPGQALADHPPGTGGKFTVHINRGIGGFDHLKVPGGGMGRYQVLFAIHERLFEPDPKTGKIRPRLAIKAAPSDNFKKWRVTLRKGVRFANGKELTSEAYVHHFSRCDCSR